MDRFSLATLDFNFTRLAVVRLIVCLVLLGSFSTVVAVTLVSS